ncbi:MAG: hypothetical protein IJK77_00700 [Lachnospiraceae bacterium]|nr:hypothetical protein [Lachnospiraceae bacterium]
MNETIDYQKINAETIDRWIEEGWEWGTPISHEVYEKALQGEWDVGLTPTRPVPHEWFGDLRGKKLLFDPLTDPEQMKQLAEDDCGVQFSHTLEEQIGGQLEAGFRLLDLREDTNGEGRLHELNVPTMLMMRSLKE